MGLLKSLLMAQKSIDSHLGVSPNLEFSRRHLVGTYSILVEYE